MRVVLAPLKDIAMHIVQSPLISRILTNRSSLAYCSIDSHHLVVNSHHLIIDSYYCFS